MDVNYPKPWDQQEGETDKAYRGFRTYLALKPPRSYQKAADALNVGIDHMKAWGRKYDWITRARQYDANLVGQMDTERATALKVFQAQVVTEEVSDYQKLRKVWQQYFDKLIEGAETTDPDDFLDRLKKLTAIRAMVDEMARKAASLPNTYRAAELPPETVEESDQPFVLSMDGPRRLGEGDSGEADDEE